MKKEDFVKELQFLHKNLSHYLTCWPAGKEGWKPAENSFSLLELACHLYHLPGDYALILGGKLKELEEKSTGEREEKGADDLRAVLDHGMAALFSAMASLSDEEWETKRLPCPFYPSATAKKHLFQLITHMHHHRGQFHLYLKQLGQPVDTETVYYGQTEEQFS